METKRKPMTYAQLGEHIAKMTPEQRACEALWCGEEKGGQVYGFYEFRDDQINAGEGLEDLTPHREYLMEHDCMTAEEADAAIDSDGGILWRKGQPVMDVEVEL